MEFTADQVWGLAVAADRINNGYIKEDEWLPNATPPCRGREANKKMVKDWLRQGAFSEATAEDIEKGREYRRFFNTYTMKALMGGLSDFDQQALRIAQMDTFTGKNMLEFAVISCLPSCARREQARTDFKRDLYSSEQLVGEVGDVIKGEITVVSTRFNPEYNKHKIVARMGEAFVDFWYTRAIEGTHSIKGKIKAVRGDKTTQLNFVKISG